MLFDHFYKPNKRVELIFLGKFIVAQLISKFTFGRIRSRFNLPFIEMNDLFELIVALLSRFELFKSDDYWFYKLIEILLAQITRHKGSLKSDQIFNHKGPSLDIEIWRMDDK